MHCFPRRLVATLLTAATVALTGCASTYLLDNEVRSFSQVPTLAQPMSYRFERLPSQTADPAQPQVEAAADAALHTAGFRRDDAAPRYAIQVSARMQRVLSPYADPWDFYGGWGFGLHGRHIGLGFGGPWSRMESPWYERDAAVIVRELASNRVVFESRAHNNGPWLDPNAVLPAMFRAALQGFPNPPQGPRRVDIQLGR